MAALSLLCALLAIAASITAESNFSIQARGRGKVELPSGCLYDGRWYSDGASVRTRETCLVCACAGGALSCRRRACAPLPEPPPRCHALHRRGDCCPHIHCPDGVQFMMPDVTSEDKQVSGPNLVGLALPACVEGGTVYAAGSAMSSRTACEQCFCLGGVRRCVRPQCLPAPRGCQPRPAPGACCPQRYYCEHATTVPPTDRNPHDCQTGEGTWVDEGKQVASKEGPCTQCFCLRGTIQCQHLSCAPRLQGCKPLVQAGQCCPHQYQCNHTNQDIKYNLKHSENNLEPVKSEDRSLHSSKSAKRETTIKILSTVTDKTIPTATNKKLLASVYKERTTTLEDNDNTVITESTQTVDDLTKDITTPTELSTTEESSDSSTTEQPENSIKIMINGTINCTAELSSTSLLYNITNVNDTLKMQMETQPRIPFIQQMALETHTFPANELITERNYKEALDENESFVINVTSSLRTNISIPSTLSTSTTTQPKTVPLIVSDSHNISKKTKEDADYDYNEPTLPPSLPNLKIIPFLAADAVVDKEIASKENSYPILEREDKFPIYYPSIESKDRYPIRRADVYNPTQYPVFTNKVEPEQPVTQQLLLSEIYGSKTEDFEKPIEFTVGTSFGSRRENKPENKLSLTDNMKVETPTMNLFSPPVETEGGFIPKGPGIIDDYYAVYPSTPSGPVVPHLTTSVISDNKECIANDGRQIAEGESVSQACSTCMCAWGELHCSPRPCSTPRGCMRRPVLGDTCCGELVCEMGNTTKLSTSEFTSDTPLSVDYSKDTTNISKINPIEIITTSSTTTQSDYANESESKLEEINKTILETFVSSTSRPYIATTTERIESEVLHSVQINENNTQIQEYEEDDDDEGGFSLGSVLQLLLRETYETTTTLPFKKMPPAMETNLPKTPSSPPPSPPPTTTSTTTTSTTTTTTKKPTTINFVPNSHYSFIPSKMSNTVNRIDHLVLGEATAIRRTTTRPTTLRPVVTTRKIFIKPSPRPITTESVEITSKGHTAQTMQVSRPPNMIPGLMPGLPKLAGCNIYGRMYRVGRIITELSTPCQECRCTELGVQCKQLIC